MYLAAALLVVDPGLIDLIVHILASPWLAPVLLLVGVLGVLVEVKAFAHGLAGALGVLALALFFGSHFLLGMTGWLELVLLGAGVLMLVVEAVALPGAGAFGVLGALALLASVYLSLVGHPAAPEAYGQAAGILGATLIAALVSIWALLRVLPKSGRFAHSGVVLGHVLSREGGYIAGSGRPELVGTTGTALTDLRPAGSAEFRGERLDVVADGGYIVAGTPVVIADSDGYRHVVRPAE
jgi:membrane-bound serine protease (ClpP class)